MQHTLSTRKNWVTHINWMNSKKSEALVWRCSVKKCSLKLCKIHRKTPEACNFMKKETLVQVFSCEFSETFIKRLWWLLL